jgi:hypothetical protein
VELVKLMQLPGHMVVSSALKFTTGDGNTVITCVWVLVAPPLCAVRVTVYVPAPRYDVQGSVRCTIGVLFPKSQS